MENILIIGAHFDDAELGVGGTAAKLISLGKKVFKCTLTDNETNYKEKKLKVSMESSMLESKKACEILGVSEINFTPPRCVLLTGLY